MSPTLRCTAAGASSPIASAFSVTLPSITRPS
jgi:hypothetical protein